MAARKGLEFIHIELKRDTWMSPETTVHTPDDAIGIVQGMLEDLDREMLVCINLANSGRVINASICSVGSMDMAFVSPPEILRGALLSGAKSMILLHNHTSGRVNPSREDMEVTKRMATASSVVGVNLLDSIIIGENGKQFSFKSSMEECLRPAEFAVGDPMIAAEAEPEYSAEEEKADNTAAKAVEKKAERPVRSDYVSEHRKAVVQQMVELIESGKAVYSKQWSADAMRPRNPISGALYHGGNRLILMNRAIQNGYRDPRWMTFKQLSEKGYFVKKGEKAVRLEKWIFTEKKPVLDADGNPVKNAKGKIVYEEVLLPRPKCNLFSVFNAEQVRDFPEYEPKTVAEDEAGKRIEALIQSSDCPINEVAQDKSFYSPTLDEIYLPLRSAFTDQNAFAEVAAHEMVHSTGHPTRLAREFGGRDPFGKPDDKYCMEELRAELGALFLMGDIGIPPAERELYGAAAYLESYLSVLKENPNLLFKIASDADKASEFLFDRFRKVYDLRLDVELIPERKDLSKAMTYQKDKTPDTIHPGVPPFTEDAAKSAPVL